MLMPHVEETEDKDEKKREITWVRRRRLEWENKTTKSLITFTCKSSCTWPKCHAQKNQTKWKRRRKEDKKRRKWQGMIFQSRLSKSSYLRGLASFFAVLFFSFLRWERRAPDFPKTASLIFCFFLIFPFLNTHITTRGINKTSIQKMQR